eukprot:9481995-Alexandrium_andersonii.AAC.1
MARAVMSQTICAHVDPTGGLGVRWPLEMRAHTGSRCPSACLGPRSLPRPYGCCVRKVFRH